MRTSAYLNESPAVNFADCLLIPYCIWDEVSQLPIVENIVQQAITESINTYLLGEKQLEQKLDALKEDMKAEHSLREISDPAIQVVDTFYHRIEGYRIAGNLLMFASDYQNLKKDSNRLFYIQQDKFRPVNKILKTYDFVKTAALPRKTSIHCEKETGPYSSTTKSILCCAIKIANHCPNPTKRQARRLNSACKR